MKTNIKNYRQKQSLSQKDLAKRIGVAQNTISNWENGYRNPRLNEIPKIAKSLGCTIEELFENKVEETT